MRFGVIIAARTGSSRLPRKALLPLLGIPTIAFIIKRLKTSRLTDNIILATTDRTEDDVLTDIARAENIDVYRGDENDVLKRFVHAARGHNFSHAVRVTGDCPFVSGSTLDYVLSKCTEQPQFDLATTKPAFPHGIDYEVYPVELLETINRNTLTTEEREHMLNYIYAHPDLFTIQRLDPPHSLTSPKNIFLLDTQEDYRKICSLLQDVKDIQVDAATLTRKYSHAN